MQIFAVSPEDVRGKGDQGRELSNAFNAKVILEIKAHKDNPSQIPVGIAQLKDAYKRDLEYIQ